MGLFGFDKGVELAGRGYSGKKCDYCGSKMDATKATKGPHIGNSILMKKNRYFCSNNCLSNWKIENS